MTMMRKIEDSKNTLSVMQNSANDFGSLAEKIILQQDLASLSSKEKVSYLMNVCNSLNLNFLTKPIQLIKFQNKEIMYFTKDATEQIRFKNNVSIVEIDSKIINGTYIATAKAILPNGRTDSSTGAVCVDGLKGDSLANAIMKAETKAKRRVTLSICGLGALDESEIETIQGAVKVDAYIKTEVKKQEFEQLEEDFDKKLDDYKTKIYLCSTLDDLKSVFKEAYTQNWGNEKEKYIGILTEIKDDKKKQIEDLLNDEVPL